jgi:hypothetical protein
MNEEQSKLLPFYADKWHQLIFSSEKIDKSKAENIVRQAYKIIGYEEPIIVFADSPSIAIQQILSLKSCMPHSDVGHILGREIWNQIKIQLSHQVIREIRWQNEDLEGLINHHKHPIIIKFRKPAIDRLSEQYRVRLIRLGINTVPERFAVCGNQSDFCISVLNCEYDVQKWEIFQSLVKNCGLIFCFKQQENVDNSKTNLRGCLESINKHWSKKLPSLVRVNKILTSKQRARKR